MFKKPKTIQVTVDKSHLLTIGERMYTQSIELLRELVNNAYDADATKVFVELSKDMIVVEDNGAGMNEKGLAQYFNIGSTYKKKHSVSPRFGRKRIGEFGIGKFAALGAAQCFTVRTKRGKWFYTVVFDKEAWHAKQGWDLEIKKEPATELDQDGTRVMLTKLTRQFSPSDVEKHLRDSVPIRAKKFEVFLNGGKITVSQIPGRRVPISFKTMFGKIQGEIIIAASSKLVSKPGIECRVKGVLIKRSLFGLENSHTPGLGRITGSVDADFLPITSSRADFIKDQPAYELFYKLIRTQLENILKEIKKERNVREIRKMSQALRKVLDDIRQALKLNPDLIPSGRALARRRRQGLDVQGFNIKDKPEQKKDHNKKSSAQEDKTKTQPQKSEPKLKDIEKTVVKRIRLQKLGVSCTIAHLGEQGPEVVSEKNLIYVNQDHPL